MSQKKTNPENTTISERGPIFYKTFQRLEKKKNATCMVKTDKGIGSGFFCKVKINNNKKKFLFTAYHILDKNNISKGKFKIILNGKEIEIEIKDRIIHTNEFYDYTCIELLESENIIKDFFQIYHKIENYEIDSKNDFLGEEIGDIHYPEKELSIEFGKIIRFDEHFIVHSIPTSIGSSGSPLILINRDLELFGIHTGSMTDEKLNHGVCFIDILNDIEKNIGNMNKNSCQKEPYVEPKKKLINPSSLTPFEKIEDNGNNYELYSWVKFVNTGRKWYFLYFL